MLNYDGKLGAVGRMPYYMRGIITTRIVRFDIEQETPVRGADGFCIECADDEAGEAIGKITQRAGPDFEGYTQKSRHAEEDCCAMSSRRATAGFAPAI